MFNSSRYRLLLENQAFAEQVPEGSLVLDAGAGEGPYRGLFEHARYESADFQRVEKEYASTTYVCDLSAIPVEDARFDFILLNQVMEHLPEPARVLAELHRVLKGGGKMIYSAPLFYEEHETPYDFYRYTQFGVRHLMESAGFRIERLDWLEGYFGTVAYQLDTMARYLPRSPAAVEGVWLSVAWAPLVAIIRPICRLGAWLFHRLEKHSKYSDSGYPKNYVAIVVKPTE